MKLNAEENLLVVSNKKKNLNEVLDKLAAKDSKKVASYLVQYASLPRELRISALRLVLNDYVKIAKELVLSDEFMYRLNWYEKFPEYQLVNFWNILASSNADKFDEEKEAVRFKRTFYLLLLMNADAVEFTDKELEALLKLSTPESTFESFKEFMEESNDAFYDYECNFDGMSYEDFKTVLKKCSTVADIRNIASKYGISVPKRLKKDELVAVVLEGLRRQGKATDETEAQLKKMSAISLQRYAKVNGVKASTEMKKDDIIEYIMNRIDSSPKAVRKPRIQIASLPELEEFEFSKDFLREVNIVDDEEDDLLPAAPAVGEMPAPVEEAVVEEPVAEPVVEEPVQTVVSEELVNKIDQLINDREEQTKAEEERYNKMVELYEQRLNQLEGMIVSLQAQPEEVEEDNANEELVNKIDQLLNDREEQTRAEEERYNKMVAFYEERLNQLEEMIVNSQNQPEVVEVPVAEEVAPVAAMHEVDAETDILNESVQSSANEELLNKIDELLSDREARARAEEERYNKMVELYEQRLNHLQDMIASRQQPTAAPITINLTYPEESKTIQVIPVPQATPAVVVEEVPAIEEPVAPAVMGETELAPVVVDSTFDTLTPAETVAVVDENMEGLALKKGAIVVAPANVSKKTTKEEKLLEKELIKQEKRMVKEEKKRHKEEKLAAKLRRKEEKLLEKELIKLENELVKREKKLEKEEKKLEKKNKLDEAAATRAEIERIKEERILNQERLRAEKELAKQRRKEEKYNAREDKKAARKEKKEKKRLAKRKKLEKKEQRILASEMAKADKEAYQLEKKKQKIEKIRIKNDLATYKKAKSKAFWKFIKFIILLAILIVIAALTITTLIDLGVIQGYFADYVNAFTTQYIPFMSPEGVVRVNVTNLVGWVIYYINALTGNVPAQPE